MDYFGQISTILCLIGIIGGLITCFYGYRLHIFFIRLAGFIILGAIFAFLSLLLTQDASTPIVIFFALVAGFIGGLIGAQFAMIFHRLMIFIIGMKVGLIIAFFASIYVGEHNLLAYILIAIIFGSLAQAVEKIAIVFATSLLGSFAVIWGVAKLTVLNSMDFSSINSVDFSSINGFANSFGQYMYVLAAAWCVLCILALIFQFGLTAKKTKSKPSSNVKSQKVAPEKSKVVYS